MFQARIRGQSGFTSSAESNRSSTRSPCARSVPSTSSQCTITIVVRCHTA